jgi:hypothetical protein
MLGEMKGGFSASAVRQLLYIPGKKHGVAHTIKRVVLSAVCREVESIFCLVAVGVTLGFLPYVEVATENSVLEPCVASVLLLLCTILSDRVLLTWLWCRKRSTCKCESQ